jgi:hypothetical protein
MFSAERMDWGDALLVAGGNEARRHLAEVCAPAADRLGLVDREQRCALENLIWSQIHGRAHLAIDHKLGPIEGVAAQFAAASVDLAGLIFSGPDALKAALALPFPG